MSVKVILFDLDGTLLPMDQDVFIKTYFGGISKQMLSRGYDPKKLIESIFAGTYEMIKNNGEKTNEKAFWDKMVSIYGESILEETPYFDSFYIEKFDSIKEVCGFAKEANEIIKLCKKEGFRVALATNPIFPAIATKKRIKWAGIDENDFELITTYDNSYFSKPNLKYYEAILSKLGVTPEECLMVGNDVNDDMVVTNIGMKTFLLTNDLINTKNVDINLFPHGGYQELKEYILNLNK